MLINKNVLEWFLLKICKEHTLPRSTNLFSKNHPHTTLFFWLIKEGWQMPKTEKLLYQTVKSIHRRCYIKKDVLKNFAIFTGKYLRTPFLKNICIRLSLNRLYKVIIWNFFLDSRFQNHPEWQYYKNTTQHIFRLYISPLCLFIVNVCYTRSTPSVELTLSRWGGLSTKRFQPECVNEESSTERCS